jgi:hypothetical protein
MPDYEVELFFTGKVTVNVKGDCIDDAYDAAHDKLKNLMLPSIWPAITITEYRGSEKK